MTVTVGEVVTEVIAQPEPAPGQGQSSAPSINRQQLEAELKRLQRLQWRVRAEGFDD